MSRAAGPAQSLSISSARLSLISEFQLLIDERSIPVPHGVQRVLAFLAVARRPTPRTRIAGQLWMDVPEKRALGNLRSALWRLRHIARPIVRAIDERLTLDSEIRVDITELSDLTGRVLDESDAASLKNVARLAAATDILTGWEEEWLIVERERFRERRLLALERACETFTRCGDYASAVQSGLAAVECDPLRESAQRLLMRVHLAEGNRAAALRSYRAYRALVEEELGIQPSQQMLDLVATLKSNLGAGRSSAVTNV